MLKKLATVIAASAFALAAYAPAASACPGKDKGTIAKPEKKEGDSKTAADEKKEETDKKQKDAPKKKV